MGFRSGKATADSGSSNTWSADQTLADGTDFALGTSTGTKIGTATTQKLGFFNATPVVQPGNIVQTYSTASSSHTNPTTTTLTNNSGGTADGVIQDLGAIYAEAEVANNFAECATQINALIADLANVKQVLNAVIDRQQSLGLMA